MLEPLVNPRNFFASLRDKNPSPLAGFFIAVAALLLLTLAKLLALRTVPSASAVTFQVPWWLIGPAVGFFGALFVWGALTFGLALVLGDSARTAEWVGWSFVPMLLVGLVELAVAALWPAHVQPPPKPRDPFELLIWSAQVQTMAQATATFLVFTALELVAVAWGGYLLWVAAGTKRPQRAAVSAAVFVTFMFLFWLLRNYPSVRAFLR